MKHLTDQWAGLSATAKPLDRSRLGQCYPLSYRYATDHMGWTLVHGSIQGGDNPRIGHGFCLSPDGTEVYEPASDTVYDKRVFEALFKPTYDATFDFEEVMLNSIKMGHYGPWGAAIGKHAGRQVTAASTLWHVTDRPVFVLDPAYRPNGDGGRFHVPGLFLTDNPELWRMLWRPMGAAWAVEIDHKGLAKRLGTPTDDRDQWIVDAADFDKIEIVRTVPIGDAIDQARRKGKAFVLLAIDTQDNQFHIPDSRMGFGTEQAMCGDGWITVDDRAKWTTREWVLNKMTPQYAARTCPKCLAKLRRQRT